MSRVIKFRAWDGTKMINPYSVRGGKCCIIKQCPQNDTVLTDDDGVNYYKNWDIDIATDYPLMQFTGVLDSNRQEIYEGDIVKITNTYDQDEFEIGKVAWGGNCYPAFDVFVHSEKHGIEFESFSDEWNTFSNDDEYSLEVIGNIYENPELLEKAK